MFINKINGGEKMPGKAPRRPAHQMFLSGNVYLKGP